ncbi:putative atp-binding abc transporter protein [Roseobacter sp. SK209-2-6]|uniref:ABC transporter ATP-binding protein n=1 Tax=Roseobacter sp. SK209-2-6 TaxID=388739 RepID=UPI0000F3EEE4|nr:sn-glycerol-3-phosphate ABC transporter ATP-binding protein UgpC [Roseobacter sp. SK209-2-6]EBA15565.1 putative atp-binding abc transporter protein [Roseobacter sp. SK209-2-6]
MAPILDIKNLYKNYGATEILKDINVAIEPGDFLVLVGPSGCGKSTLLNCIAGLEPITGGTIDIGGRDMTHVSPKDRDIAMVFQSYALYPTMSVAKNITFGMKVRGVDQATQERKLAEVAAQLQIEPLLNRRPGQLSGGQRQRVAMGRALVRDPKLFLFDEPLSNLDAKLRVSMRSEIKKLHQNLGATMVYVTHDQIEAMTLATKIVVMKGGVVQQIGTPAEIYNHPANLFVADFMGSPAMNLIPARTRRNGKALQIEIERAEGEPMVLEGEHSGELPADIILGLRPEDIAEAGFRSGQKVQAAECRIDLVEPAGADTYVVSELGGRQVTARLHAETKAQPGAMLDLAFDLGKVSYFAPDTGKRLN